MIYLQLFLSFLKIGLFSFGGGYAALPLIQGQVVTAHGWLSTGEFTDLITISQMTPGPIAINGATFVGIKIAGLPGAFVATLGCITPSCIIVTLLLCHAADPYFPVSGCRSYDCIRRYYNPYHCVLEQSGYCSARDYQLVSGRYFCHLPDSSSEIQTKSYLGHASGRRNEIRISDSWNCVRLQLYKKGYFIASPVIK